MFQILGNFFGLFGKKDASKEEEKIFALGERCREEENLCKVIFRHFPG
ncbi:25246_t:CDS:2 [Gigaspora rosea]|nr:25246_t:CDS:2 [Gigaspora rosea]